jgi:hypothetical protein
MSSASTGYLPRPGSAPPSSIAGSGMRVGHVRKPGSWTPGQGSGDHCDRHLRLRGAHREQARGRLRRGCGRSRARPGPRRHGRYLAVDGGPGDSHVARALASRSIAECEDLARRVASAPTPDAARAIATESLAGAIG